ncbi:hypothetical protein LCM19_05330 [Qipengyuania flava]|nr:hypothetical protein [Qipengyuania flava]
MKIAFRPSIIAAALSCTIATPVFAQNQEVSTEQELETMRAQLRALTSRIDELESDLAAAKSASATQAAAVVDSPEEVSAPAASAPVNTLVKSDGWSFTPRGRLMFDAGTLSAPVSVSADDGFGNEVRRARIGASGDLPGGFGYKFEVDFAGDEVAVADAILTYDDGPLEIAIGQHNNFQSLEELTSSLHTSFMERAAFTDAFGFERRIGASASYGTGILLAQLGVFTDNFADTGTDNRGIDGRIVVMPEIGATQLHFAGSLHYNDLGDEDASVRYRQRPLVHFTSTRFVDSGKLAADNEFGIGLEAAAIAGSFHAVAEGYRQKVDMPIAGSNPAFFGGYAEAGYFLTAGDTRGYKGGKFDRVKPANPVGEGGFGSLQVNLRYDYLDLNDGGIVGGIQNGYQASLIWKPTDYTLFSVNYGRLEYDDAALPTADGDRDYGVDAVGVRAQVDF